MNALKKILTALLLLLFFTAIASAQDNGTGPGTAGPEEPSDTEIVLPPMYLEIEDLTVEDIDAVIPDEDSVYLAALEMPLPEPDDIEIPAEVFAVTGAKMPKVAAPVDGTAVFYSEGSIGAGTSSNITGDINLYRIGVVPELRLRYFHDGYDGFAGQSAGEGYSFREELMEAELSYYDENVSTDIFIKYNELENGLQGRTSYFTMTHRIPRLTADINWKALSWLDLMGGLEASSASLQLNSADPLGFSLFSVSPEAALRVGNEVAGVSLQLGYNADIPYGGTVLSPNRSANQLMEAELSGDVYFADEFQIEAAGGVIWDNFEVFRYPFRAAVAGVIAGTVDYSVEGGYRASRADYSSLWTDNPFAAGPASESILGALPLTHGWFAVADLSLNAADTVVLQGGIGFSAMKDALRPVDSEISGLGTLGIHDAATLDSDIEVIWRVSDGLTASAGWEGQLFNQMDLFRPKHRFYAAADLVSADRNTGLNVETDFMVWDESQTWQTNDWLPRLGIGGYLRFTDGVALSVSAQDLTSGFLPAGRNYWNGYLDRGLYLQIKTKISL